MTPLVDSLLIPPCRHNPGVHGPMRQQMPFCEMMHAKYVAIPDGSVAAYRCEAAPVLLHAFAKAAVGTLS